MDIKQSLRSTHAGLDPVHLVQLCRKALAEIERLEAIETAARQMMDWQKHADPYDFSALLRAGDRLRAALGLPPAHP